MFHIIKTATASKQRPSETTGGARIGRTLADGDRRQVLLSVVRPSDASNSLTAGTNIASVVKP